MLHLFTLCRGSLLTRSLADIVKKEDVVTDSEYLVTLLVAVPVYVMSESLFNVPSCSKSVEWRHQFVHAHRHCNAWLHELDDNSLKAYTWFDFYEKHAL